MRMFNNQTTIISTKSNEQSNELLKDKMKFIAIMQQIFGVLNIIGGSFFCLGILTAIIGIPLIIAGVKLFKSGGAFSLAAGLNREEDYIKAIDNLHGYWKFILISYIVLILFLLLYILFVAVIIFGAAHR